MDFGIETSFFGPKKMTSLHELFFNYMFRNASLSPFVKGQNARNEKNLVIFTELICRVPQHCLCFYWSIAAPVNKHMTPCENVSTIQQVSCMHRKAVEEECLIWLITTAAKVRLGLAIVETNETSILSLCWKHERGQYYVTVFPSKNPAIPATAEWWKVQ